MRITLIGIFVFIMFAVVFAQQEIFIIELTVSRENDVDLKSFEISTGTLSDFFSTSENFNIKIISFENIVLFDKPVPIGFQYFLDPEPELLELDKVDIILKLPYSSDAERIELYRNGTLIYTLEIADYICNNDGTCDQYENAINCPSDCKLEKKEKDSVFLFAVIGILLIIVGILLILMLRKSKSKEENILRKLKER